MAAQKDELTQLLLQLMGACAQPHHIGEVFQSEYSTLNDESTLDPGLEDPEHDEDFDGDDAYARDVCQRRDGPL